MTSLEYKKKVIETYLLSQQEFRFHQTHKKATIYRGDNLTLKLYHTLDKFELYSYPNDNEKNLELENKKTKLKECIGDIMAVMRELIDWFRSEYPVEVDGFTEDGESDEKIGIIPPIDHKQDRELTIYVWGRKRRDHVPYQIDHNFNAAILHGKKEGVDWTKDGRHSEDVRNSVKKAKGYVNFMTVMITQIEQHNYTRIGINCKVGRHRSQTCAIELKETYYPKSIIHFLEVK